MENRKYKILKPEVQKTEIGKKFSDSFETKKNEKFPKFSKFQKFQF